MTGAMTGSMTGSMTGLSARLLPGVAILTTTLAGALPWGSAAGGGAPIASRGVVLPLAVIHACGYWRAAVTPAWIVFLSGLFADALTGGPLGYWPLVYLLGLGFARSCALHVPSRRLMAGWATFACAAVPLAAAAWAISSLYQLRLAGLETLAWPLAVTTGVFPALAAGFQLLARSAGGERPPRRTASD